MPINNSPANCEPHSRSGVISSIVQALKGREYTLGIFCLKPDAVIRDLDVADFLLTSR